MKHFKTSALVLAALLMAGCQGNANSSSSGSTLNDVLTTIEDFTLEAGNVGYFSLGFNKEGYQFVENIDESSYSSITFGGAFEGMEIYDMGIHEDDGCLAFITIGELVTGHEYGIVSGSGITTSGESFEINVPIVEATLTADGLFYSTKSENTITLNLENGAFHSDIDKDDIVLGGGLSGATISKITPVESTGYEVLEHGSFKQMYQSVQITFTDVAGPESYAHITVLDSGTTYNEDVITSFEFLRQGGELLTAVDTYDLKDVLVFAFANLTLNTSMTIEDISVAGAFSNVLIESLEIINYLDYGKAIALSVVYPSCFLEAAIQNDYENLEGSFIFSSNTNAEGEEITVTAYATTPEIEEDYEYDDKTKEVTTTLTFLNGVFNSELTVENFSYDLWDTDLVVSGQTLSLNDAGNVLTLTCVMPDSFDHGFVDITVENIFKIYYAFEDKVGYYTYNSVQYLA